MPATEDLLFAETDGGCAYCGLRDQRVITIHHLMQTTPKIEDYDNKLLLCHNCHQAHHAGKGATAKELASIKRRLIIKTLTVPGHNILKLAYRQGEVVAMPFLVLHLLELRLLEKVQVVSQWSSEILPDLPQFDIEVAYRLTEHGRGFVKKWQLNKRR